MLLEEKLVAAVVPIVPICRPHYYRRSPDEEMPEEFCSYYCDSYPVLFADGKPETVRKDFTMNYCCPIERNPETKKRQLSRAIADAGFTYPQITDVTDPEDMAQTYAFEFVGLEYGAV